MLHFSLGGLLDGLILLIDDETGSYWDPIAGVALTGPLAGRQVPVFPVEITTVGAALAADPELEVARARLRWWDPFTWFTRFFARRMEKWVLFPPGFRQTLSTADDRRPEMEMGLGVMLDGTARFYPLNHIGEGIEEVHGGRRLRITRNPVDRMPRAEWEDGTRPFQLASRWYGFSRMYRGCEVHQLPAVEEITAFRFEEVLGE